MMTSQTDLSLRVEDEALKTELHPLMSKHNDFLSEIYHSLCQCLIDTGIEDAANLIPTLEHATFDLSKDIYDCTEILAGVWRDEQGTKQGEIQIREDGRMYAEVDVIRTHPTDTRWFIESVTAWGSRGSVKTELRLLAAV